MSLIAGSLRAPVNFLTISAIRFLGKSFPGLVYFSRFAASEIFSRLPLHSTLSRKGTMNLCQLSLRFALPLLTSGFLLSTSLFAQQWNYPVTHKGDQVDDYHGTKVADPYRWLEDDNSPETAKWVEAENKVTFAYLEKIPYRGQVK